MTDYRIVGKRVPRTDSVVKATGAAQYTGDIVLPGMLYGKILRSPHAHAKIVHIDTSRAQRLPGVRAVITGNDTLKVKFGVWGSTRDQYLLAVDKVRYAGEDVAAVAAIDEDIAEEALGLIQVEYEELPAVLDPMEAMREGAPRIHDHVEGNICAEGSFQFGEVEEGFRQSDYVYEDRFTSSTTCHAQIEPYCALASFDPSGKLDLWIPNQSPFTKRKALSNALRIPVSKVRVHHSYIGGAFGGRSDTFPAELCAAILSLKTQRPVRIVYTREETMVATRHKHPLIIDLKTGVQRDGTLMAQDVKVILDGGAYASSGPIAVHVTWAILESTYKIPVLGFEGREIYTNKTPCSMMQTQPSALLCASEMQMDRIAEDLKMDPAEIRLKNAVEPHGTLPSGSVVTSFALKGTIEKAVQESGWKEKRAKLGPGHGLGMACSSCYCGWYMGLRTGSSAYVKFNEDGGASVFTGNVDNGQGNESMMVQIAAEELGLGMDDISLVSADTELTPQDPGSYSQSSCFVSGNAVKAAAADAQKQILDIAADKLDVPVRDLAVGDRRVYIKERPEIAMAIDDIARLAMLRGKPIMGRGGYLPEAPDCADWSVGKYRGQQGWAYTCGTVVAEVEVDRETGRVKVVDIVTVGDCGFPINPMAVEGQWEGIAIRMVGETLQEKHVWDENGRLTTDSFMEFKLPTALDIPRVKPVILESLDSQGPYGAKEGSHAGNAGIAGAIANAIYDAIGVRIKELPITPEAILRALKQ